MNEIYGARLVVTEWGARLEVEHTGFSPFLSIVGEELVMDPEVRRWLEERSGVVRRARDLANQILNYASSHSADAIAKMVGARVIDSRADGISCGYDEIRCETWEANGVRLRVTVIAGQVIGITGWTWEIGNIRT